MTKRKFEIQFRCEFTLKIEAENVKEAKKQALLLVKDNKYTKHAIIIRTGHLRCECMKCHFCLSFE